jgi:hypothetical protein
MIKVLMAALMALIVSGDMRTAKNHASASLLEPYEACRSVGGVCIHSASVCNAYIRVTANLIDCRVAGSKVLQPALAEDHHITPRTRHLNAVGKGSYFPFSVGEKQDPLINFRMNLNISRMTIANVLNLYNKKADLVVAVFIALKPERLQDEPGSAFKDEEISGLLGGLDGGSSGRPSFSKGLRNEPNTDERSGNPDGRYYRHPERPQRHFRLGYEIALIPVVLVGGLYYMAYAFRHGRGIKVQAALFYLLLGLGGVACGIGLLLMAAKSG